MIMKMAEGSTAEFSLTYPDPTQVEGEECNDPFSTSSRQPHVNSALILHLIGAWFKIR